MAEKRIKTATESLLQIAVGIEIAIAFFGALALNGLNLYPGWLVLLGAAAVVLILLVLYRCVSYRLGRILGHVVQVALLGAFFWDVVMGFAVVVGVGFWIFGAIRGPLLDRGTTEPAG